MSNGPRVLTMAMRHFLEHLALHGFGQPAVVIVIYDPDDESNFAIIENNSGSWLKARELLELARQADDEPCNDRVEA